MKILQESKNFPDKNKLTSDLLREELYKKYPSDGQKVIHLFHLGSTGLLNMCSRLWKRALKVKPPNDILDILLKEIKGLDVLTLGYSAVIELLKGNQEILKRSFSPDVLMHSGKLLIVAEAYFGISREELQGLYSEILWNYDIEVK